MKLIFASNNTNKIFEIQSIIPYFFKIKTLKEAGIFEEIPEPYDTFRENAFAKASYIYKQTGQDCFSEDSGLMVNALDGKPGVHSARYAGEPRNDSANNQKLLSNLAHASDRSAHYQSTICLIINGEVYYFEGQCPGSIALTAKGDGGFGYDPIFIPYNYKSTFSEILLEEKLKLSHRTKAFLKLADFLKNQKT